MASRLTSSRPSLTRAASTDSMLSHITMDASSNLPSSSSTPPTSAADTASVSSQSLKLEETSSAQDEQEHENTAEDAPRSHRARTSLYGSYNVKVLAGTAQHAPKKFQNSTVSPDSSPARQRVVSGDTLVGYDEGANASTETVLKDVDRLVRDGIDALDMEWSVKELPQSRSMMSLMRSPKKLVKKQEPSRRISTRSAGIQPIDLAHTLSSLGKRARNRFDEHLTKSKRELKRLADTAEFAKIEKEPVIYTVWSNGKYVVPGEAGPPPRKRAKVEPPAQEVALKEEEKEPQIVEEKKAVPRGPKVWATKGLYAGQKGSTYWNLKGNVRPRKDKPDGAFPLPIFAGDRMIRKGRNFKLPFDVCNPLTERQPKPDEWRRMPKSEPLPTFA